MTYVSTILLLFFFLSFYTIIQIANVLRCLGKHYPCMAAVERLTYNVSVCCSEYRCIGSGRNPSMCADKQTGKN
jgi:hypothetical protein